MAHRRDPRTKEELLNRMLSYDFDGDIRNLGEETARLVRVAPNRLELQFPATGRCYELAVKLPRGSQPRQAEGRSFGGDGDGHQTPEPEPAAERPRRQPRGRQQPNPRR